MDDAFLRYLAAKKTVDDRALNAHVWSRLIDALPDPDAAPIEVLEVGCGIGTMIERLVERGALTRAAITAIDAAPEAIAEARRRLPAWAVARGLTVEAGEGGRLRLSDALHQVEITTEAVDLFDFIDRERDRRAWDLLVAHALLDLLDIPSALPPLLSLLRPGGLLYASITFDGATIFQPEIDRAFDDHVEQLYHRTMDERRTAGRPSGDSRAGRHLFSHLRAAGATVVAAGASDWVVVAGPDGYAADEASFLHFIVDTVAGALRDQPDQDRARFADWISERHAQIDRGELIYIAHQLDLLARRPPAPAPPAPTRTGRGAGG